MFIGPYSLLFAIGNDMDKILCETRLGNVVEVDMVRFRVALEDRHSHKKSTMCCAESIFMKCIILRKPTLLSGIVFMFKEVMPLAMGKLPPVS